MKTKTDFPNPIISVLSIMLIILGAVPDLAFALDGQLGDSINSTNSTPHSNLIIEKFYTDPKVPKPSNFVSISALVKNEGDAASDQKSIIYTINGAEAKEDVRPLEPGAELYIFHRWPTPDKEGTVLITASLENVKDSQKEISMAIAENPLPDLVIENIVPKPSEPLEGKPIDFTVRVKNQGLAPSGGALAKYYINGTPGQDISVPALSDGESKDLLFSLTPDQVKGGTMEVKVDVDAGNTVIESNETNNEFGTTINVKFLIPDLTLKSLSWSPGTPKIGENITFTATVRNIGSGDSPTSNLKYDINGKNEVHSDILAVPALAAGEAKQSTFYWTPGNEGKIEVTAMVDPDAVIPESDETNNQLKQTLAATRENTSTGDGGGGSSSSSSGESGSGSSKSSSGSSKSSSGSGGIGSGFTKEPAKNVAAKELATRNVANGNHITFDFSRNSTCILYIEYDAERTFLKTTTTVEELKSKSTFVPILPPGRVYRHVNIWIGSKGGGLPASLKNGIVGFRVEKDWINNNSVNESLVTLQWYDKSWEPLYTEKVGEDDIYVYFKSKTPGFSFFAITENTGEVSKSGVQSGVQIGAKMQNTPGSLESIGKGDRSISGNKSKAQEAREVAKTVIALSLPIFLIFVGYLVVKKKI